MLLEKLFVQFAAPFDKFWMLNFGINIKYLLNKLSIKNSLSFS